MALTISIKNKNGFADVAGDFWVAVADVTFDSSYPTGGESLVASDFKLPTQASIIYLNATSVGGYVFSYDFTNKKLLAYRQKDPAAAGGADIALPEVADTTSLSTVVTRVLVLAQP